MELKSTTPLETIDFTDPKGGMAEQQTPPPPFEYGDIHVHYHQLNVKNVFIVVVKRGAKVPHHPMEGQTMMGVLLNTSSTEQVREYRALLKARLGGIFYSVFHCVKLGWELPAALLRYAA